MAADGGRTRTFSEVAMIGRGMNLNASIVCD